MKIITILSAVCGGCAIFLVAYGGWTLTRPHARSLPVAQVPQEQTQAPPQPEVQASSPFVAESTAQADSLPSGSPQDLYKDQETNELVKEYLRQREALTQLQLAPPPPATVQQNPSALLNYLNSTGAAVDAARQASEAAIARMNAVERARFEAQKKSVEQK